MPICTHFSRALRSWLAGSAAVLMAFACLTTPVAAQDQETVAVISVSDYDELLTDVDFLGQFGGQVKAGQQANNMLLLFTQNRGLQGLDTSKPWGAVVQTDGFQFTPVICLPVTDYDKLLELPTMFQFDVTELEDGISEIAFPNQSVYVKQVGNWAYLAQTPEQLDNPPADPSDLLNSLAKDYDLGVQVMVQKVPEMYRMMAIEQIRAGAEQGLQQEPEETDEAFEARRAMTEANIEQIVKFIQEADKLELGVNTDPDGGVVTLDFAYSGVSGSDLAKQIEGISMGTTLFTGCLKEAAAVHFNVTAETPADVLAAQREVMLGQMKSLRQQIMNAIDQEADLPTEEATETVKDAVGDLMDVVEATGLSGKFDTVGYVDMPEGTVEMVIGGYAKDTSKIESALKKLATLAEEEPAFPGVNWNAETHAGFTIHTMSVPVPDDEAQRVLGDDLNIALALGNDAFYFSLGQNNISNLKAAIDGSEGSTTTVKPMQFSLALTPLVRLGLEADPDPVGEAMLDALTLKGEGKDQVHFSAEKVDDKLRMRCELEKGVLHAFGAAAMQAQRQGAGAGF